MSAISAEEAQSYSPEVAPGWYPDPDQAGTQRYWDGSSWTDQRAPLPTTQGFNLSAPLLLAIIGALAAAVGVFLPMVDSPTSLHIADNSVMATDVIVGALVLLGSIGSILSAYQNQHRTHRDIRLEAVGVLVLGAAIYYGTGDRLDLHTTGVNGFGAGIPIDGSPGIGLYAMGIGGLLLLLAGYLTPDHGPADAR